MATSTICKKTASSALSLIFWIVLTQQIFGSCLASPITNVNIDIIGNNSNGAIGEGNDAAASPAPATSTTAPEPPPTTQTAFSFEVYPEYQKLRRKAHTSGLYKKLRGGLDLPTSVSWNPTALWNSTVTNKTAACQQYLRENGLDRPDDGNCAASYVCRVTESLHRFPAVLIQAECGGSESRCIGSYHTGLGYIEGSRGSCQAQDHFKLQVLVFQPSSPPQSKAAEEIANAQKTDSTGSGTPAEPAETTLQGEWMWSYEFIPLNCRCQAK